MPAVCERQPPYALDPPPLTDDPLSLSERELAHLWAGQRFPEEALASGDGGSLRVLFPGLPGRGAGPDFRDAVIAAPRRLLRGDVELHVRASDFRRHGHHRDAAYNGLALHVVFADDEGSETLLASGRRVPVAALAPWFQRRAGQIGAWLRQPPLWETPCLSAVRRLGAAAVAAALDGLGDERFRQRVETTRLLLAYQPADEVVWQGLLEALGYGGDRSGLRALALRLPWRRLSPALRRLPAAARHEEAHRLLLAAADTLTPPAAPATRPGNESWRRLEGAGRLAARYCAGGLAAGLAALVSGGAPALVAGLTVAGPGSRAYIGRGRALEIAANVVLPYAVAAAAAPLAWQAQALYRRLPRPAAYGAVRHLDRALAGAVPVDGRRQQGMLHLLRRYCSQGACGRCPLS